MPDKLKVMWLTKGLGSGGEEKLLEYSLPYLDYNVFQYQVAYFLPRKNALVPQFERARVPVHCLQITRPYDLRAIWRLFCLLRREKIDILHVHSPYPAILGRFAALFAGVRAVIYTEHNIVERFHPLTKLGNVLTYPLNDAMIAISSAVSDSMKRWRTARSRHISIIHNAIDFGTISALKVDPKVIRAELGINDHNLVVGNVAHIQPQKGHPYLVQAARLVIEQYPDVTFVIVGGEKFPGGIGELEKLASQLGIRNKVIFTGFRNDALRIMASFDIFVLPSVWEGFGIVLLEAMASGKPVIGTAVGGILEIIEDGVNGYLVEPRNPQQIADRIIYLIKNEALRNRMGDRGKQMVKDRFDIRDMVKAVENIYISVINSKKKT
jgi:glycosyltransferase involved in cell wall biosynthesis